MTESASSPGSRRLRLWGEWSASTLLALAACCGLRVSISEFEKIYRHVELEELPLPTTFSLAAGPYLWAGVLPAAAEGIRRIRKKEARQADAWFFWSLLGCLGAALAMGAFLFLPIVTPPGRLRP